MRKREEDASRSIQSSLDAARAPHRGKCGVTCLILRQSAGNIIQSRAADVYVPHVRDGIFSWLEGRRSKWSEKVFLFIHLFGFGRLM